MIFVFIAILLFIFIYGSFDPAQAEFFPQCVFHSLTGLQCPGCGSQRAFHQLLHFNLGAAFRYNAFMVLCIPLLLFLLLAELLAEQFPRIHRFAHNSWLSWGILAVVLLWWLLRNLFGW